MRTSLISLLFVFTYLGLFSQYDIVWDSHFGGEEHDSVFDVLVTSQGNYFMAGYTNVDGTNTKSAGYLVLVSEEGDLIWEKAYGVSGSDRVYSAIEVADGFVVAGFTSVGSNNQAWVFKVDFEGELVWERTFGGDKYDYINKLIQTNDGGYATIGGSQNECLNGIGVYEIQLFKLSSDGSLEWAQSYDTAQSAVGPTISQDTFGNFIIGTESVNPLTQTSLIKTSPTGELIWRIIYDDETTGNIITSVKVLPDGYIIAGGSGGNARVIKTDLDGSIVWKAYVGAAGFERVNDFIINDEGHIICVGVSSSDSLGLATNITRILLFELDADGRLLWRETSFDSKYEFGKAMVLSPDGGLAVAGSYDEDSFSADDIFIMKLQAQPTAVNNPDPTPALQLYPNPTAERIVITVLANSVGSSYTIYNSLGQLYGSGKIDKLSSVIDVADLEPGEYVLKTEWNGQISSAQFVKL